MAFGLRLTVAKYHDHSDSNVRNACNRKHPVHTSTLPTKISKSANLVTQYHSTPIVNDFCGAKIINAIPFQQLQTKKHPIRNDLDKIFVTLHHYVAHSRRCL